MRHFLLHPSWHGGNEQSSALSRVSAGSGISKELAQDDFGYAHLGSAALARTRQIDALIETDLAMFDD
jgi:hypothetical protein